VAVAQDGRALLDASVELKRDKEVVLAAVAENGGALVHASAELKNDKEAVLVAVAQDGLALEYSSIAQGEFQAFLQSFLAAHITFNAFLLAVRPSSSALQPAPATRPASWLLDGVGEDAGRHVRVLIAEFSGAPCGKAWTITSAAAQNCALK
jgi:hypothetical protein